MDINWIKIKNFRRFSKLSTLDLTGKLVALIGPNEAGKSSILKAISYISNDVKIPDSDLPRGSENPQVEIKGKFSLSQEDLNEARLTVPTILFIKRNSTNRTYELDPKPPKRNIQGRQKLKSQINRLIANQKIIKTIDTNHPPLRQNLSNLSSYLDSESEDLNNQHFQAMDNCSKLLDTHLNLSTPKYANDLSSNISELRKKEMKSNPTKFAINVVSQRIPQILDFTSEQRDLKAEYNLTEVVKKVPVPLYNLTQISGLDLKKLNNAAIKKDRAEKRNLLEPANKKLQEAFSKTWSQSGIHVDFDLESTILKILIVDSGSKYSSLGERSDGLKQFVALQAFTTVQRSEKPILLIDEAELHLHYDGQADLVQMLTKQKVANKIIYSTHSAGCLPEDLGVGTRLIIPNNESLTSKIQNKFWQSKEQGFMPLLFGMGATTLAFFPVRNALVSEGQTEMLLLPTILRQATNLNTLGFQVVPGLSESSLLNLPAMETAGKSVAYFVDADSGGDALKKDLIKLGISESNIFSIKRSIGMSYTTEDLININHYVTAVNKVLSEFHPEVNPIKKKDLLTTNGNRVIKVEEYCKKNKIDNISKIEVAYQLLDFIAEDENLVIVDSKFKDELKSICNKIKNIFKN